MPSYLIMVSYRVLSCYLILYYHAILSYTSIIARGVRGKDALSMTHPTAEHSTKENLKAHRVDASPSEKLRPCMAIAQTAYGSPKPTAAGSLQRRRRRHRNRRTGHVISRRAGVTAAALHKELCGTGLQESRRRRVRSASAQRPGDGGMGACMDTWIHVWIPRATDAK